MILIDDLHVFTGSSDADADCDFHLAKVFAILKNIVAFVEQRKSSTRANHQPGNSLIPGGEEEEQQQQQQQQKKKAAAVSLVVFSAPLQSRGASFLGVCRSFFDFIFEIRGVESESDSDRDSDRALFSMAAVPNHGRGFRCLFAHRKGHHIKLESVQFEVEAR